MIVFHHLPRTGGTFLRRELKRVLAPGPEVSFGTEPQLPRLMCDADHRPQVIVHHCSGPLFSTHFRRRADDVVITLVRDPVDLVYSNFAYMHRRVARGDFPAGDAERWAAYSRPLSAHVDDIIAGRLEVGWMHIRPREYDLVGVTAQMDASVSLLNRSLGLSLSAGPRVNHVDGDHAYRRAELAETLRPAREIYAQSVRYFEELRERVAAGEQSHRLAGAHRRASVR